MYKGEFSMIATAAVSLSSSSSLSHFPSRIFSSGMPDTYATIRVWISDISSSVVMRSVGSWQPVVVHFLSLVLYMVGILTQQASPVDSLVLWLIKPLLTKEWVMGTVKSYTMFFDSLIEVISVKSMFILFLYWFYGLF